MRKQFGLILLIFALVGCGNQSYIGDNQGNRSAVSNVGTHGQLISIQSDNVKAAGYDESTLVMSVQFKSGALYEYYGVPADLWIAFVAAQPHPWSQVGYPRLVQGGLPYKRIG
jgi:KTSC domain